MFRCFIGAVALVELEESAAEDRLVEEEDLLQMLSARRCFWRWWGGAGMILALRPSIFCLDRGEEGRCSLYLATSLSISSLSLDIWVVCSKEKSVCVAGGSRIGLVA